jgi:molecular chaperone Hsp33
MIDAPRVEDAVAPFQLETGAVRGRIIRLGRGVIDPILRRHDYPRPVALLLGEALALAGLIGALFKAEGKLSLQIQGDGVVQMLVAEVTSAGGVRGYARVDMDRAQHLTIAHAVSPAALIGDGVFAITFDQGPDMEPVQGIVPLEGATLSACAESYFAVSEQAPTRIRAAVAEALAPGQPPRWLAGGALIQRVAADDARGETDDAWETAEALFATVADHELADPDLPADRLLYRLFHEGGVRLAEPKPLEDACPCDRNRLTAILRRFDREELATLVEPDGLLHIRCQFCARDYVMRPEEV